MSNELSFWRVVVQSLYSVFYYRLSRPQLHSWLAAHCYERRDCLILAAQAFSRECRVRLSHQDDVWLAARYVRYRSARSTAAADYLRESDGAGTSLRCDIAEMAHLSVRRGAAGGDGATHLGRYVRRRLEDNFPGGTRHNLCVEGADHEGERHQRAG